MSVDASWDQRHTVLQAAQERERSIVRADGDGWGGREGLSRFNLGSPGHSPFATLVVTCRGVKIKL